MYATHGAGGCLTWFRSSVVPNPQRRDEGGGREAQHAVGPVRGGAGAGAAAGGGRGRQLREGVGSLARNAARFTASAARPRSHGCLIPWDAGFASPLPMQHCGRVVASGHHLDAAQLPIISRQWLPAQTSGRACWITRLPRRNSPKDIAHMPARHCRRSWGIPYNTAPFSKLHPFPPGTSARFGEGGGGGGGARCDGLRQCINTGVAVIKRNQAETAPTEP